MSNSSNDPNIGRESKSQSMSGVFSVYSTYSTFSASSSASASTDTNVKSGKEEFSDELETSTAHSISSFNSDLLKVRKQQQLIRRFQAVLADSNGKIDGKKISSALADVDKLEPELEVSTKIIAVLGPDGTLLKVSPDLSVGNKKEDDQEVGDEQKPHLLREHKVDNFAAAAAFENYWLELYKIYR